MYSRFTGIEPVRCFDVNTHFMDEIDTIFVAFCFDNNCNQNLEIVINKNGDNK